MAQDVSTNGAGIVRIWRGRTVSARADAYERYLHDEGLPDLRKHALGVHMLRQDRSGESDFVVMSFWPDIGSMSRFAGTDPRRIRHLAEDADYLVELPDAVEIFEVKASTLPPPFTKTYMPRETS